MRANLDSSEGLIHSQRVLLALTAAGLARQEAYAIVQRHAMQAWREGVPLLELLRADPEVTGRVDERALAALFDVGHHTRHVDRIFARVFGAAGEE
jgi:adenylosuccinate lyase